MFFSLSKKKKNHTNIILMCVPHRFNHFDSAGVTNEVCSFDRKLKKLVKIFNFTSILKVEHSREILTSHRLYLNAVGKVWISKQIATYIRSIFQQKEGVPISMGCKSVHGVCTLNINKITQDDLITSVGENNAEDDPNNANNVKNSNQEGIRGQVNTNLVFPLQ